MPIQNFIQEKNISGKTKKEFVLNFLFKLYSSFSHLSRTDRILSYLNFFCENFEYDNESRDKYLKSKQKYIPETFEQNENSLFNLLNFGKGVCMQFAQSLTILSAIDNENSNDMPIMNFSAGVIKTPQEPKVGHALNLIFVNANEPIVIDISSMLHARDGDFKQDKMAFGMIYLNEYLKNLSKEKISFLDENNGSLQYYSLSGMSASQIYDFLNKPIEKMSSLEKERLFYFSLPKI